MIEKQKDLLILERLRIKVKKGEHGFIPAFFYVEENGSKWKVKLRVIRKRKNNSYLSSSDCKVEEGKKRSIPTRGSKKQQSAYSVGEIRDEYEAPFVQLSSDKVDEAGKSTGSDLCQNFQILKCS